ncbi:MAG TPA: branched-chain alpha-keto acid dehydrogenase subunit E2, partial [Gammaproteobacteria bacterium]|nr:branched-chain alpha-keto acid dehydrogenase subunit E2 [Gammaproteobacteria bacterium]
MASINKVTLPDIGDFDEVEIIEILVSIGDIIKENDSIITLESDKASMEIPSPYDGKVTKIHASIGDKISNGSPILDIETDNDANEGHEKGNSESLSLGSQITPVVVPDIGDFDEVDVIEVLVQEGDDVEKEQSIITLESDKASMEIPSPISGKVDSINISVGDKIGLGTLILNIKTKTNKAPTSIITENEKSTDDSTKDS